MVLAIGIINFFIVIFLWSDIHSLTKLVAWYFNKMDEDSLRAPQELMEKIEEMLEKIEEMQENQSPKLKTDICKWVD